jgi:cytochrome c553
VVKTRLGTILIAIGGFALGATFQRYWDTRESKLAPPAATPVAPVTEAIGPPRPGVELPIQFEREPLWAYGFDKPRAPGEVAKPQNPPTRNLRPGEDPGEQTRPRRLDGSGATYSLVDVRDGQNVIDWFPSDHPRMPDVIAHGPVAMGKATRGCGSCHLPNGKGRPENAPVAGLPVTYFIRQIQDFRSGLRRSADQRKPNTNTMIELARALSEEELNTAAEYFGSMAWTRWIRVVETDRVPATRIVNNLFLAMGQSRTEPIAGRIIELPEDEEQAELYRNPRSGFLAYVPLGSVRKGRDLVMTGGMRIVGDRIVQGKTAACTACHGLDLMGVADVPPIAGRSPSYLVRQMWDIQQGTRNGPQVQLMKLVVANLTADDLVSIAAYVASRPVPDHRPARQLTELATPR